MYIEWETDDCDSWIFIFQFRTYSLANKKNLKYLKKKRRLTQNLVKESYVLLLLEFFHY